MRPRIAIAIVAIALLLLVLRAATDRISDPDVGWIVATGRLVLSTGAAPSTNGFSFAASDQPWIMHEWLLGPMYALGWGTFGASFFPVLCVLTTTGLAWLLLEHVLSRLTHPIIAAIWMALLFFFGFDRLRSARPIGVSLVLACALVVVAFRPRLGRGAIALAVATTLLWTNIHGSFPLALVILGAGSLDATAGDRRRHHVALGLAALSTLINPYGPKLHGLVASYALGLDETIRLVHRHVLEFSPIWRSGYHVVVSPIEIVFLFALVALALDALKRARGAALLTLSLAMVAFLQARNASLAILVGGLVLVPQLELRTRHLMTGTTTFDSARSRRALVLLATVVGLVAVTITKRSGDDWIDPTLGGGSFARLARSLPAGARVFVPFRCGGLLLLLNDRVTILYDSRNDPYPPNIAAPALALKDGVLPSEGLPAWLGQHGTTHAILPTAEHVRSTPGDARWPALAVLEPALRSSWRRVGEDDGWVLLERSD